MSCASLWDASILRRFIGAVGEGFSAQLPRNCLSAFGVAAQPVVPPPASLPPATGPLPYTLTYNDGPTITVLQSRCIPQIERWISHHTFSQREEHRCPLHQGRFVLCPLRIFAFRVRHLAKSAHRSPYPNHGSTITVLPAERRMDFAPHFFAK